MQLGYSPSSLPGAAALVAAIEAESYPSRHVIRDALDFCKSMADENRQRHADITARSIRTVDPQATHDLREELRHLELDATRLGFFIRILEGALETGCREAERDRKARIAESETAIKVLAQQEAELRSLFPAYADIVRQLRAHLATIAACGGQPVSPWTGQPIALQGDTDGLPDIRLCDAGGAPLDLGNGNIEAMPQVGHRVRITARHNTNIHPGTVIGVPFALAKGDPVVARIGVDGAAQISGRSDLRIELLED